MKMTMVGLEKYQSMSDEELKDEMLRIHRELNLIDEEQEEDHELQAAIALAQSLKTKYSMEKQRLKKLLKTVQELSSMRGL